MLCQPQGHSAAGRIMWIKNTDDTIGNRTTRKFPSCSAVHQSTAPPGVPSFKIKWALIQRWQLQYCILYIFCVCTNRMSSTLAPHVLETPCNNKTERPRQDVLCMFEPLPFSPQAMFMHLYAVRCRWDALTVRPVLKALQLLYSAPKHDTSCLQQS
jgi:hypothetical protein